MVGELHVSGIQLRPGTEEPQRMPERLPGPGDVGRDLNDDGINQGHGILSGHGQNIEGHKRGRTLPDQGGQCRPGCHQAQLQRIEIQPVPGPNDKLTIDNTARRYLFDRGRQNVGELPP